MGYFSAVPNAANCTACPIGRYQSRGAAHTCAACPKGKHTDGSGAVSCKLQRPCRAGRYATVLGICKRCPPGRFQPNTSRLPCAACALGHVVSANATACITLGPAICPAGKFFNLKPGVNGAYHPADPAQPTPCAPCAAGKFGHIVPLRGGRCFDCAAGRFKVSLLNETSDIWTGKRDRIVEKDEGI